MSLVCKHSASRCPSRSVQAIGWVVSAWTVATMTGRSSSSTDLSQLDCVPEVHRAGNRPTRHFLFNLLKVVLNKIPERDVLGTSGTASTLTSVDKREHAVVYHWLSRSVFLSPTTVSAIEVTSYSSTATGSSVSSCATWAARSSHWSFFAQVGSRWSTDATSKPTTWSSTGKSLPCCTMSRTSGTGWEVAQRTWRFQQEGSVVRFGDIVKDLSWILLLTSRSFSERIQRCVYILPVK